MGAFLDKAKTEKTNESGQGNDLHFGLAAMQGWRIEMEDAHCSVIGLPKSGFANWSFFAVFDGHAGGTVSKYSSRELLNSILHADADLFDELAAIYAESCTAAAAATTTSPASPSSPQPVPAAAAVSNGRLSSASSSPAAAGKSPSSAADQQQATLNDQTNSMRVKSANGTAKSPVTQTNSSTTSSSSTSDQSTTNEVESESNQQSTPASQQKAVAAASASRGATVVPPGYTQIYETRLKEAIRKGFLDLDEKMRRMPEFDRGEDKSGSTAIACLISPSHVYFINCGDSRAILVSNNTVVLATNDHKPINPIERERIQNAGGSVMIQRVNGSLAVSRALGDYEYKCVEGRGPCEQLVSPEPEIYSRERVHDKDEFLVLACDGIWDVMTNNDLREYIHARLKVSNDLVKISNEILDMCLSKVSRDFIMTKKN